MATRTKKSSKKRIVVPAKKKSASASSTDTRGRRSQYTGQRLTKTQKDNPRREGTSGHKSFGLIRNGMLYEDFIAAGGVRRDLEWDVAHGWVKLSK